MTVYKHSRKKIIKGLELCWLYINGLNLPINEMVELKMFIRQATDMLLEKAEWPKNDYGFWYLGFDGEVLHGIYFDRFDKEFKEFGNCFRTRKQAIKARDKIKKVLEEMKK